MPRLRPDDRDRAMMGRALDLAREAASLGEVPVGAVVVRDGKVLAQAFNLRETLHDPTAHAERLAITLAGRVAGILAARRLHALRHPRAVPDVRRGHRPEPDRRGVVYGAADPKAGACRSLYRLVSDPRLNHRAEITAGVLELECGEILSLFFQDRRAFSKLERHRSG